MLREILSPDVLSFYDNDDLNDDDDDGGDGMPANSGKSSHKKGAAAAHLRLTIPQLIRVEFFVFEINNKLL